MHTDMKIQEKCGDLTLSSDNEKTEIIEFKGGYISGVVPGLYENMPDLGFTISPEVVDPKEDRNFQSSDGCSTHGLILPRGKFWNKSSSRSEDQCETWDCAKGTYGMIGGQPGKPSSRYEKVLYVDSDGEKHDMQDHLDKTVGNSTSDFDEQTGDDTRDRIMMSAARLLTADDFEVNTLGMLSANLFGLSPSIIMREGAMSVTNLHRKSLEYMRNEGHVLTENLPHSKPEIKGLLVHEDIDSEFFAAETEERNTIGVPSSITPPVHGCYDGDQLKVWDDQEYLDYVTDSGLLAMMGRKYPNDSNCGFAKSVNVWGQPMTSTCRIPDDDNCGLVKSLAVTRPISDCNNSVIRKICDKHPSIRHLIDPKHPVLIKRITHQNSKAFVRYLKMIKNNSQAHWVTAFLMMLYETENNYIERSVRNAFEL